MIIDQFTRWLCPKCRLDGIDSWNKAMFDGILRNRADLPNPLILGDTCSRCLWPVATCYTTRDAAPRAIAGPGFNDYYYEAQAFFDLETDLYSGVTLEPSLARDADWSRGCIAAKGQLQ